jgi:hypothetical protein
MLPSFDSLLGKLHENFPPLTNAKPTQAPTPTTSTPITNTSTTTAQQSAAPVNMKDPVAAKQFYDMIAKETDPQKVAELLKFITGNV